MCERPPHNDLRFFVHFSFIRKTSMLCIYGNRAFQKLKNEILNRDFFYHCKPKFGVYFSTSGTDCKLIYTKTSNACANSHKYFEVKLILKTLFLKFFSN